MMFSKPTRKPALIGKVKGQNLKESNSILVVSVGQPYFEGDDLETILTLIKQKIGGVTILLADAVQRYNEASNDPSSSPDTFFQISDDKGVAWIKRNISLIQRILGDQLVRIVHWKELVFTSGQNYTEEYQDKKNKISALCDTDLKFLELMHLSVEHFLKRQNTIVNREWAFECSLNYIKEEAAVVLLLADSKIPFHFLLYPQGKLNHAVNYLIKNILHGKEKKPDILRIFDIYLTPATQTLEVQMDSHSPRMSSSSYSASGNPIFRRSIDSSLSLMGGDKPTFFANSAITRLQLRQELVFKDLQLIIQDENISQEERDVFFRMLSDWLTLAKRGGLSTHSNLVREDPDPSSEKDVKSNFPPTLS